MGGGPRQVEAAQAMGNNSDFEIILHVYWRESIAGIARGINDHTDQLDRADGYAGGSRRRRLGQLRLYYGQQRNRMDIIYVTVVILVLMVSVIQIIGNTIAKRNTH